MRAFSLIEVMIAVAILAIIAALAVPSVTQLVASARARETAQSIAAVVELARTRATNEGRCFRIRTNTSTATGTGLAVERRNSVDCVNIALDGWDAPIHTETYPATVIINATLTPGAPNDIIIRPSDRLRGDGNLTNILTRQYGARIRAKLASGSVAVVDITAQGRICTRVATSDPGAITEPVSCP